MIGPELYDHTALVLNTCTDELILQCPGRRTKIGYCWIDLTVGKKAVIQENRAPQGAPRPIV